MSSHVLRIAGRGFNLPAFPWDALIPYRDLAASHSEGLIDLSVGSPVDSTPVSAQQALADSADSPSYPRVCGSGQLQKAITDFLYSRGISLPNFGAVLPTCGSKEAVALLPWQLGLRPGDRVLIPECAYPTYEISALLADATPVPVSEDISTWPEAEFAWINFPGNPNGHVASVSYLRDAVAWARDCGAVLLSDECYAEFSWNNSAVPSLLDDRVTDGDLTGLLMLYSLSKESNFAGYRGAFVAGDPQLVSGLITLRKHCGMIVPAPVQAAMVAALGDRDSVRRQHRRYQQRRQLLLQAVERTGLMNDRDSVAGLYLWLCAPDKELDCWALVRAFAERGILVTPGEFYGSSSLGFVRVALTASDSEISAACDRLSGSPLF